MTKGTKAVSAKAYAREAALALPAEERVALAEDLLKGTGYDITRYVPDSHDARRKLPFCFTETRAPVYEDSEHVLSAEETARVWSVIKRTSSRNRAICLLIAIHGLRPAEVSLLPYNAVTVEGRGGDAVPSIVVPSPKGGVRVVELNRAVFRSVNKWERERVWYLANAGLAFDKGPFFLRMKPVTHEYTSERMARSMLRPIGTQALGSGSQPLTYTCLQASTRAALRSRAEYLDPYTFDPLSVLTKPVPGE